MAQYTNSTRNFNGWDLYFHPIPYSEGLFVLLVLLYGLKIQLKNLIIKGIIKLGPFRDHHILQKVYTYESYLKILKKYKIDPK